MSLSALFVPYRLSLRVAVLALIIAPVFALDIELDKPSKTFAVLPDKATDVVRYTLNGKDPDFTSGVYLAPIIAPLGATVKAAAFEGTKLVGKVATRSLVVPSAEFFNSAELPLTQNRDHRTYDWVQRHQGILALNKPGASSAKVVLIGDSIMHFWSGEPKATRIAGPLSWEKYIAPHQAINLGFGWDRTENVLWRLRHGEIAGLKAKAFVVLIGTNNFSVNSVPETVEGVEEVCLEIRKQFPQAKILLLGILPRSERPDAMRQKAIDANSSLKERATKCADKFIDLSSKYLVSDGRISKDIMGDFLHPTDKGYEIMGAAIDAQLKAWGL